jgi:hypothetical protein
VPVFSSRDDKPHETREPSLRLFLLEPPTLCGSEKSNREEKTAAKTLQCDGDLCPRRMPPTAAAQLKRRG